MSAIKAAGAVVQAPPETVLAVVRKVLTAGKHTIDEDAGEENQVCFVTKRTMLSWPLDGVAAVTVADDGRTELAIALREQGKHDPALMDGVKNKKKAQKLVDEVTAAL